jgi:PKD repeat protein
MVQFNGSASDPDGDTPLTIAWTFGDGEDATGSLTPTHSYDAAGVFTATLIVTDSRGAVGADSLRVTAAVNQGPFVNIGPDLTAQENIAVQFSAIVSDPEDDPLTSIEWSLGDKTTITGTLSPVHAYSIAGDYTVILVVTDSRGGLGTDSLVVQVGGNQPPPPEGRIYLPLIAR